MRRATQALTFSAVLVGTLPLATGCGGGGQPTVSLTEETPVDPVPDSLSRERRRMNIDQLQTSMEQVSGGIGWTEERDGETVDLFAQLSVTLGKPDYLASTHEDLVPGLLFQKFLDDASKSICTDLVAAEQNRGESERVFLVHADLDDGPASSEVEANLRSALLRFHGTDLPSGDDALDPWLELYSDAAAYSDSEQAWTLVCVSLFTHPDFYSF